jgi:hypothetical protein
MKKIKLLHLLLITFLFSCSGVSKTAKRNLASDNTILLTDENCDRFLDSRSYDVFGEGGLVCFPKGELLDNIDNLKSSNSSYHIEMIPGDKIPSYIGVGSRKAGIKIIDNGRNWTQSIRAFTNGSYSVQLDSAEETLSSMPLSCSVSKLGSDRVDVSVKETMGLPPEDKVNYKGHKIAVGFKSGSQFEGQEVLAMELNGYVSQVYDPKKSLYKLSTPDYVELQCYLDR